VANRLDPFFHGDLLDQLEVVKRHLKAYMFNHRRANVRIYDAGLDLKNLDDGDIWFTDPVHPIEPIYST
jgi:hypothetical protein